MDMIISGKTIESFDEKFKAAIGGRYFRNRKKMREKIRDGRRKGES